MNIDAEASATERPGRLAEPSVGEVGAADAASMFLVHYLDLVRLARLLLDDRETAEDVVQDGACQVFCVSSE